MDYKKFIIEILNQASKIANKNFGKVTSTIKPKDYNQVLTETDLEIGKFLVNNIKKIYPEHNIIDEETGVTNKNSLFTWVIDPIDGTSNFAVGVPTYGIMIGLLKNTTPIASGISLPYFSEILIAQKGKGTILNGKKVQVTKETNLSNALVAYGTDGHKDNPDLTRREAKLLGEIILNVRNIRASNSVFDSVMVAEGKYGGFLSRNSKIWDNVAQHILIEEAGGIYTDFFGKQIDYSNPLSKAKDNFTFCAASPVIHGQLQKIIQRYS